MNKWNGAAAACVQTYQHCAKFALWVGAKMHRMLSSLALAACLSAETLLHTFNIPHIEGWWLPLASSGLAAGLVGAWVRDRYAQSHLARGHKN